MNIIETRGINFAQNSVYFDWEYLKVLTFAK